MNDDLDKIAKAIRDHVAALSRHMEGLRSAVERLVKLMEKNERIE